MMTPIDLVLGRLKSGGFDPRQNGKGWEAKCPAHKGTRRNLSISTGTDGTVLLHCHHANEAGGTCSAAEIAEVLGLKLADLFPPKPGDHRDNGKPKAAKGDGKPKGRAFATGKAAFDAMGLGKPVAHWTYQDAAGEKVMAVARFETTDGKTYRPIYRTAEGWRIGSPKDARPLYHLPELTTANLVVVCEGEKCADLARSLGLVATTSAHGADSPHKTDWTPLAGKDVAIIPDFGPAGDGYATKVIGLLSRLDPAPRIKVVRLPGLRTDGDDIEQWIAQECIRVQTTTQKRMELLQEIEDAPYWEPSEQEEPESPPGGGFAGFAGSPIQVRPISVALRPVPPMVAALIPEPFRKWLGDIADRACCPLDLPVMAAVVSVGALVGRKVGVRPKRYDDWTVVPNLWGMGVLPPGYLKTHCLEEPKRPLARLEMEARERHAQALNDFAASLAVAAAQAEAAKSALKDAAKKKKGADELRRLADESLAKPDLAQPTLRRYVVNDATVEKLGELLAENPTGLLLYRDELMGFLKSLEKQGHEGDRAFYLEAWNGTGHFTYDRIGRGSVFIPSNTISVLGGIQPGKLAAYIRSAGSGENEDGFIPRFQLAVYPDTDQPFVNVDRWPDTEAKNRAHEVFKALDALDPTTIGATVDEGDDGGIPYLRFAPDAQDFFDGWRAELETRVRSSQESAGLTSHLSKYRSLMPSLALLFHLIDVTDGAEAGPVSLKAAELAAAWCDYLEQHARRIYQAAFDGDPEPAQRLAERISASLPNPFTTRDVITKGWKSLDSAEAVERAVAMLEEHGWVLRHEVPPGPKGGRPKVEIHVNPRVMEGGAE